MISYNVSVTIDSEIEQEWVEWMKTIHIPDVMATGCFTEYRFYKLMKPEDEEGLTFIMQYKALTMDDYHRYSTDQAPALQQETHKRYKDRFVAFRTIMVEV